MNIRDNDNNDKTPVIRALEGKLCINDVTFEHSQLRESKEYLQRIGAEEALFYPENDDEIEELTVLKGYIINT